MTITSKKVVGFTWQQVVGSLLLAGVSYIMAAVHVATIISPFDLSEAGGPSSLEWQTSNFNTGPPALRPNTKLRDNVAVISAQGGIFGAEHILLHPNGDVLAFPTAGELASSLEFAGWLVRIASNGGVEKVLYVGGRVLASRVHPANEGVIVACDATRGLLHIDLHNESVSILTSMATDTGVPVRFCDDLDIAADGVVYFSDATDKPLCVPSEGGVGHRKTGYCHPEVAVTLDVMRGRGAGRLLAYDPADRTTRTLMSGLHFANGVALAPDQRSVLIAETLTGRILRYWLPQGTQGLKVDAAGTSLLRKAAGIVEVFAQLPALPDNIRLSSDGGLWVACPAIISPLGALATKLPPLRWLIGRLPPYMWPPQPHYGLIVKLASDGSVTQSYHDPDGLVVSGVTSVSESADGSKLYLGRLLGYGLAVLHL